MHAKFEFKCSKVEKRTKEIIKVGNLIIYFAVFYYRFEINQILLSLIQESIKYSESEIKKKDQF